MRRMKESLSSKVFYVDTLLTDSTVISELNIRDIELKLKSNGYYEFNNCPLEILKYQGQWDLSGDMEISFFIFKLPNGEVQKNRSLYILIDKSKVYFK